MEDPKYRVSEKVLDVGLHQPCVLTATENYVVVQNSMNYDADEVEALSLHVYNIETNDIWRIEDIQYVLPSNVHVQVYINDNIMAACFRTVSDDGEKILRVWSTRSHELKLENYFSGNDLIDLLFHSSKSMLILLRESGVQVMQFDSQIFFSGYHFASENFHDSVSNVCFPFILHSNRREKMIVWNIDVEKKQVEKHLDIRNFDSSFDEGKCVYYNGNDEVDETIVDVLYVSSTFVVLTEEIVSDENEFMEMPCHKIRLLNQNAESIKIIKLCSFAHTNPGRNPPIESDGGHVYKNVQMMYSGSRLFLQMNASCYGEDEVYMIDMKDLLSHQRSEKVSLKLLKDLKEKCQPCSFHSNKHIYVMNKTYISSVKVDGEGFSPVIEIGEPFLVKLKKLDFWSCD